MIEFLTNALGGSLIGSLASVAQKYMDNKQKLEALKLKNEFNLEMSQEERRTIQLQLESEKTIAGIEFNKAMAVGDLSALEQSIEADRATYSVDTSKTSGWLVAVDFLRGITRPVLTAGLASYCVLVTGYNLVTYGSTFTGSELSVMTMTLVDSMATYTGLAISWWFGSRDHSTSKNKGN